MKEKTLRPVTGWTYAPYCPPFWETGDPYICRVAPGPGSIRVEWLGGETETYRVEWKTRASADWEGAADVRGTGYTITGLTDGADYAFRVTHGADASRTRLARPGETVGEAVINYLHPEDDAYAFSGHFLCSPCLLRLPDGALLASMDVFGPNGPQNLEMIFRSEDDGKTWHYLTELFPCFWGRMFLHRGALYMMGASTEYGDLLIGRSDDGGRTFGTPTVLLRGSGRVDTPGVHMNPEPPVTYAGRVWHTLEWGAWSCGYHAALVGSFPEDADPLDPASWAFSYPVKYDPAWPGVAAGPSAGNIEGTLVVLPDGGLYNVMRYDMTRTAPNFGRVLAYRVDTKKPDAPLAYSHAIALPGNHAKFMIRQDEKTGDYYTIIDRIRAPENTHDRNLLSLMRSKDGENWTLVCDLIDRRGEDPRKVGFQYVWFFIEGDDILFSCRTAINGAASHHNTNYATFHRVRNFRELS